MSTLLVLRQLSRLAKHTTVCRTLCNRSKTSYPFAASLANMSTHAKSLSQKQQQHQEEQDAITPSSDEWRIIYRLPLIRLASAFNRVKIPYGLLNAIVVPAAYSLEMTSQISPNTAGLIAAVGITSWLTLAICSMAVKNLIGIMYMNDANDRMKLAYVDYWGKRHDVCINLDDLVPEWEKEKKSKLNFYLTLSLYSNESARYKLLQNYGSIEDRETFTAIFGE